MNMIHTEEGAELCSKLFSKLKLSNSNPSIIIPLFYLLEKWEWQGIDYLLLDPVTRKEKLHGLIHMTPY